MQSPTPDPNKDSMSSPQQSYANPIISTGPNTQSPMQQSNSTMPSPPMMGQSAMGSPMMTQMMNPYAQQQAYKMQQKAQKAQMKAVYKAKKQQYNAHRKLQYAFTKTGMVIGQWTACPNAPPMEKISCGRYNHVWGIDQEKKLYSFCDGQWTEMPGSAIDVNVGSDGACWSVNEENDVFRWDGPEEGWTQVPGKLAKVTVGSQDHIWGVSAAMDIYRYNAQAQQWEQIPGKASQITVGRDGTAYALFNNQVYIFQELTRQWTPLSGVLAQIDASCSRFVVGSDSFGIPHQFSVPQRSWRRLPGQVKSISIGADGWMWALNPVGQACYMAIQAPDRSWMPVPGTATQIECGCKGRLFAINNGNLYRFRKPQWDPIPGQAIDMGVGMDGSVWVVNPQNDVFRLVAAQWMAVPGKLQRIAVGSAHMVWGVDPNGQVFRWAMTGWQAIPAPSGTPCVDISVGADGTCWCLDANHDIYHWNGTNAWQKAPGRLSQIDVASWTDVLGTNAQGEVYEWAGTAWNRIPGPPMKHVSVGADGMLYGVDTQGAILCYRRRKA
eukprot:gnl/Trimastix_PCT/391.p1 GENE.gnl/Trimastix_PCT/391~~gnl/Trimastix_PCT/391.p1  ORF type:complete len:552 (+),score=79.73 gnl/Trimastix_PCT/391:68-1723(+)